MMRVRDRDVHKSILAIELEISSWMRRQGLSTIDGREIRLYRLREIDITDGDTVEIITSINFRPFRHHYIHPSILPICLSPCLICRLCRHQ